MLETIFAHVFFELAPIGLETGGCGRVGEDVALNELLAFSSLFEMLLETVGLLLAFQF